MVVAKYNHHGSQGYAIFNARCLLNESRSSYTVFVYCLKLAGFECFIKSI